MALLCDDLDGTDQPGGVGPLSSLVLGDPKRIADGRVRATCNDHQLHNLAATSGAASMELTFNSTHLVTQDAYVVLGPSASMDRHYDDIFPRLSRRMAPS